MSKKPIALLALVGLLPSAAAAQHSQVSAVAVNPNDSSEVWVCNRGNESVSVIDAGTGTLIEEIAVGVYPRTLAFSQDGSTVFVTSQRGNVPVDESFVTPFNGSEVRGQVSVIDVGTQAVTQVLTGVGVEPYGIAVSPNGKYFAVSGFRSGTVKIFSTTAPYNLLLTHQYDHDLNFLPTGVDQVDADEDDDFIADLGEPRGFVIRGDSARIFVTHNISPWISVLDVALDGGGNPTAISQAAKISLNEYPFHPIFNPVPVQTIESQGLPRFQEDIALSPDGSRALVPGLLHNVNHDVNFAFGPSLPGAFANRVYPTLTMLDATALSFDPGVDNSNRLHHELADDLTPAEYVPYGGKGFESPTGYVTIGGVGSPILGRSLDLTIEGTQAGDFHFIMLGVTEVNVPVPPYGDLLLLPLTTFVVGAPNTWSIPLNPDPTLDGLRALWQAVVLTPALDVYFSNGVKSVFGFADAGLNKMGYRAGHPSRVLYNSAGDRAIMLNRGSEDVFLYDVSGSDMQLLTVFPPRHAFTERTPLSTATPMGDLPLGMVLVEDPSTTNDDALLYVVNESTSTLSSLRIDFGASSIAQEAPQISTLEGTDKYTPAQRIGQELFEDSSRPQTAGNFNNSCASCHFEGGADGNVWQRPNGPRSTMPVYGGPLLTGLILWKGVRANLGETGPMFGGENGGTGIFTDAEQEGLREYHKVIPVPLNPRLGVDGVGSDYSDLAEFGKDLYFGTNDSGLNTLQRHAACAGCHPDADEFASEARGYTDDFLSTTITDFEAVGGPGLETCQVLQQNISATNLRIVNSGVNVDEDLDTFPDNDKNLDGFSDLETYTPMNTDKEDGFTRDDPNSYDCYLDPEDPPAGQKFFPRDMGRFSIPTKLGVFSTGPYFHDHAVSTLRNLLDPANQVVTGKYGDASYPGIQKLFNGEHDIRGDDTFVAQVSKVQLTLITVTAGSTVEDDIEAILAYISSL